MTAVNEPVDVNACRCSAAGGDLRAEPEFRRPAGAIRCNSDKYETALNLFTDATENACDSGEQPMFDRQKLETILANRFPGAETMQRAAAANAIMGLADHQADRRTHVAPVRRPFRAHVNALTTISVSTWINAPVKRVFNTFTDLDHAAEHVSGIVKIEMLTVGPFGLGARWRETRKMLGRVDAADMEVTAFERYRTYTMSHYKGGIRIETVFSFEPVADGTCVTIEFGLGGAGLPPGLLTPLNWAIAGKVQHVLKADLADLKDRLEASAC